MLAAAQEAFRKEVPHRTIAGQNGRTHQDLVVVLSQGDPPLDVKKQAPSVRNIAV